MLSFKRPRLSFRPMEAVRWYLSRSIWLPGIRLKAVRVLAGDGAVIDIRRGRFNIDQHTVRWS